MDFPGATLSFAAALLAGLSAAPHCFGMCGPLACAVCVRGGAATAGAYQGARLAAYTFAGALLGALGAGAMGARVPQAPRWLPLVMATLLVASALGLVQRLPALPALARAGRAAMRAGAAFSPTLRSGLAGLVTPLLPCGVVYGLFGAVLVSGSSLRGAGLAAAFALGSAPGLVLAQTQAAWMKRLPRGSAFVLQRVLPLAAAGVLVFRAMQAGPESCCH